MNLRDKVAVVTGGGGGLGCAFATALAAEGARIALTDIDPRLLSSAKERLRAIGAECKEYELDVTDAGQVLRTMELVNADFGKIDILVNVAGGSLFTPKSLEEITPEHWDKVLDVNLKGTFFCCQAVARYMKRRRYGKIINVSSIGGRTASVVTGVAYAAAKAGVLGLTRRLALELGPYQINVNAIAPGTVLSGRRMIDLWNELTSAQQEEILKSIPLGRLSSAEEQAAVVVFLASDDARYITGATIDVNGGRLMV